jgi:hypothetical protein
MACINFLSCLKCITDVVRCHHKQHQDLAQTSDNDRMIVDRPLTVFQLLDGLWLSLRDQKHLTG